MLPKRINNVTIFVRITQAVVQKCSVKKVFLENFTKFTGKNLCTRVILIQL